MSDHIEAMARVLRTWGVGAEGMYPDDESLAVEVASETWAAGVEALIAHEPCNGEGMFYTPGEWRADDGDVKRCDGPHTVIVKGDGTKLYADKGTLRDMLLALRGQLPSEWRIE